MVRARNSREVGGRSGWTSGIILAFCLFSAALPARAEGADQPRKDRVFGAYEDTTAFGREPGTGDLYFRLKPAPGGEPEPPVPMLIIPEIQIDGGDYAPPPRPFPPGGRPPFFYDPTPDDHPKPYIGRPAPHWDGHR